VKKEEIEAAAGSEASTIKAEEKPKKEQRSSPVTRSRSRLTPVKDEEVEVVEPPNKRDANDDESQQRGSNKKRRT